MNKTTASIIVLVIVVLAVIGFYNFGKTKDNTQVTVTPTPTATDTTSIKGCYVGTIQKDVYTLDLTSQEGDKVTGLLAYNNYQKDSSAGTFTGTYDGATLSGNYSFDSEGMHSDRPLVFKKVGNDFTQDQVTFVKNADCSRTLTANFGGGDEFSFVYNPLFYASQTRVDLMQPSADWTIQPDNTRNGVLLARVSIPKAYQTGTNFAGATLTIGRSTDAQAIKSCTVASANEKAAGTLSIGGKTFTKFTASDAGAGNLYDLTDYRAIVDGDCYAIGYNIHSTNIGNYPPELGIKEFNKSQIVSDMEKIIGSIKFLQSSN